MEGKTTIVIAQRLRTIKNQKRIIVIEDGKVVEQGSHDELLGMRGVYFRLATAQMESKSDEEADREMKAASPRQIT